MAGDVPTPAGHILRGAAGKGIRRRWICERCDAVLWVSVTMSEAEATAALKLLVGQHGGEACPVSLVPEQKPKPQRTRAA